MEEFFGFRNFLQFERTRREIKLPYDLLNDLRFRQLPDARKAHLLCLLLLSARMNNLLPNSPVKLERLIGATEPLDLSAFADFVDFAVQEKPSFEDRLANRRVPDIIRAAVLVRDGGRCRRCRRAIQLEMDHIVPVSKGGQTEESNLQTLCRRCNRAKSRKLAPSCGPITARPATARARKPSALRWSCSRQKHCSTARKLPSTCASHSTAGNSISISVTAPGGRSRSMLEVGG